MLDAADKTQTEPELLDIQDVVNRVWKFYQPHGRHDMLWRQPEPDGSFDSYKILVSEIMLQQTQVPRVTPKFQMFMMAFPTIEVLSEAPLEQVLQAWFGLGYNRRAKFLWQTAQQAMHQYNGRLPQTLTELVMLPGIGLNTAGAILAYAFNVPVVFLETNVRNVFIHHLFAQNMIVDDKQLRPVVEVALHLAISDDNPLHCPRTWYWALMDYGAYLKQTAGNAARRSTGFSRQVAFQGSRRQVRGNVLKLIASGSASLDELQSAIKDTRLVSVLADLQKESLISCQNGNYHLGHGTI